MRSAGATCGDRGPKLAATGVTATIGSEWRKWSSQEDVDTMERLRCPDDDEEVVTEPAQTTKKTELVRKKKRTAVIGLKNRTATLHSGKQQRTAVYNGCCREDQKIAESNEDTNVRRGRLNLRGERAQGTMFGRRKSIRGK